MQIHLFATDVSALALLDHLSDSDGVTAVMVPSNRKQSEKVAKLETLARQSGLQVFEHRLQGKLSAEVPKADAGISWLYSQIIAPEDLAKYRLGVLNMHGGKIPEYRGSSVLHWAIINGEREMGITWHECVAEVDAGPIWEESVIPIPIDATASDMRRAMIEEGVRLFPTAWKRFCDRKDSPRIPEVSIGRIWPRRRREDGRIGPRWPESKVRDLVRALCPPWPPATIRVNDNWTEIVSVGDKKGPDTIEYLTADGTILHLQI